MSGLSRVSSRLEKGKKTYTDRSAFHATLMHTQGNIPRQPKIDCSRQDVGGGGWKSVVEENIPEDSSAERKETAGKSKSNSNGEIKLKH